jgi:hypothetical protein
MFKCLLAFSCGCITQYQPKRLHTRLSRLTLVGALMLTGVLLVSRSSLAQFAPMPKPASAEPRWGEYDSHHGSRDAGWWWTNKADWTRAHHPE